VRILQLIIFTGALLSGQTYADPLGDGSIPVDRCDSLRLDKCRPAPQSTEHNTPKIEIKQHKPQIKRSLSLPEQSASLEDGACEAHFNISYMQMHDQIKVETSVRNTICAASGGDYALRIRTVSESGDAQTQSIVQSWSRLDGKDWVETDYYPMDPNSRLLWVRVKSNRKTACLCDT
jgi:hypothetical protein